MSSGTGVLRVRVKLFNLQDQTTLREIELVLDTGATYAVIPRGVAEELGIQPSERRTFAPADGSQVTRDLGWAGISYDGRKSPCLVVLGEEGDIHLLGSFALEGLGFEVDPVSKTLRPARQFLL
jgi:clan AA aspartic protease